MAENTVTTPLPAVSRGGCRRSVARYGASSTAERKKRRKARQEHQRFVLKAKAKAKAEKEASAKAAAEAKMATEDEDGEDSNEQGSGAAVVAAAPSCLETATGSALDGGRPGSVRAKKRAKTAKLSPRRNDETRDDDDDNNDDDEEEDATETDDDEDDNDTLSSTKARGRSKRHREKLAKMTKSATAATLTPDARRRRRSRAATRVVPASLRRKRRQSRLFRARSPPPGGDDDDVVDDNCDGGAIALYEDDADGGGQGKAQGKGFDNGSGDGNDDGNERRHVDDIEEYDDTPRDDLVDSPSSPPPPQPSQDASYLNDDEGANEKVGRASSEPPLRRLYRGLNAAASAAAASSSRQVIISPLVVRQENRGGRRRKRGGSDDDEDDDLAMEVALASAVSQRTGGGEKKKKSPPACRSKMSLAGESKDDNESMSSSGKDEDEERRMAVATTKKANRSISYGENNNEVSRRARWVQGKLRSKPPVEKDNAIKEEEGRGDAAAAFGDDDDDERSHGGMDRSDDAMECANETVAGGNDFFSLEHEDDGEGEKEHGDDSGRAQQSIDINSVAQLGMSDAERADTNEKPKLRGRGKLRRLTTEGGGDCHSARDFADRNENGTNADRNDAESPTVFEATGESDEEEDDDSSCYITQDQSSLAKKRNGTAATTKRKRSSSPVPTPPPPAEVSARRRGTKRRSSSLLADQVDSQKAKSDGRSEMEIGKGTLETHRGSRSTTARAAGKKCSAVVQAMLPTNACETSLLHCTVAEENHESQQSVELEEEVLKALLDMKGHYGDLSSMDDLGCGGGKGSLRRIVQCYQKLHRIQRSIDERRTTGPSSQGPSTHDSFSAVFERAAVRCGKKIVKFLQRSLVPFFLGEPTHCFPDGDGILRLRMLGDCLLFFADHSNMLAMGHAATGQHLRALPETINELLRTPEVLIHLLDIVYNQTLPSNCDTQVNKEIKNHVSLLALGCLERVDLVRTLSYETNAHKLHHSIVLLSKNVHLLGSYLCMESALSFLFSVQDALRRSSMSADSSHSGEMHQLRSAIDDAPILCGRSFLQEKKRPLHHEESFSEFCHKLILEYNKVSEVPLPHVSVFRCNGLYSPVGDEEGTKRAEVPFLDVNSNSLSFFASTISDDRILVQINFDEELSVSYEEDDCCLLLQLSPLILEQSNATRIFSRTAICGHSPSIDSFSGGSKQSVASTSSSGGRSKCIKLYIKRTDFGGIIEALKKHVSLKKENKGGANEASTATASYPALQHKTTGTKGLNDEVDHVELNTRFGVDNSDKLLALVRPNINQASTKQSLEEHRTGASERELRAELSTEEGGGIDECRRDNDGAHPGEASAVSRSDDEEVCYDGVDIIEKKKLPCSDWEGKKEFPPQIHATTAPEKTREAKRAKHLPSPSSKVTNNRSVPSENNVPVEVTPRVTAGKRPKLSGTEASETGAGRSNRRNQGTKLETLSALYFAHAQVESGENAGQTRLSLQAPARGVDMELVDVVLEMDNALSLAVENMKRIHDLAKAAKQSSKVDHNGNAMLESLEWVSEVQRKLRDGASVWSARRANVDDGLRSIISRKFEQEG